MFCPTIEIDEYAKAELFSGLQNPVCLSCNNGSHEAMLIKFALSAPRLVKGQSPSVEQWRSLILVVSDKPSSLMSTRTYTSSSTGIQTPFTLPFPNWPAVASRLFDCRLTFLRFKDPGLDSRLDILE